MSKLFWARKEKLPWQYKFHTAKHTFIEMNFSSRYLPPWCCRFNFIFNFLFPNPLNLDVTLFICHCYRCAILYCILYYTTTNVVMLLHVPCTLFCFVGTFLYYLHQKYTSNKWMPDPVLYVRKKLHFIPFYYFKISI